MLNFAPLEDWQSTIVDTFEQTSSNTLWELQGNLFKSFSLSVSQSEFLTRLSLFDQLGRSLDQLNSVHDNWNSYGAPAPTVQSIKYAHKILDSLQRDSLLPKRVLPSGEGGVTFIFVSGTENRAVIESLNNGEVFILLYDRRGNSKTLDWSESRSMQQYLLGELRDHLRGASLAVS